jgi:hypothetical protein
VSTGLSTGRLAAEAPVGARAAFAAGAFAAFAALSTFVIASVCALVLATARFVVCLIPETLGSDCAVAVPAQGGGGNGEYAGQHDETH